MDSTCRFFEKVIASYNEFSLASPKEKSKYYSDLENGYMSFGFREVGYECKRLKDCGEALVNIQCILSSKDFSFSSCFVIIECEQDVVTIDVDEYVIDDFVTPTLYLYLKEFTGFSGDNLSLNKVHSAGGLVYYYVTRVIPDINETDNFILITSDNFKA